MKPYEPFPPDQGSHLSGRSIHNANAESCPSYNHRLAIPVLLTPAFNNLLKGVILEFTPQNTMIEMQATL